MDEEAKPKLAVWKFASCDGCQLSLLDCEDELLAVAGAVHIANFPEASRAVVEGPYDVSLVEGSVTTPHDAERIQEVRKSSKILISIGACATAGGIQALRNFGDVHAFTSMVYAKPEYIKTLATSTAIADHVPVDFELRGCPISKQQLIEVLSALLHQRKPNLPTHSVCMECKRRGTVCVMVAHGTPCLGPITHAGCYALCPTYYRGCFGCFGPSDTAQTAPLADRLIAMGVKKEEVVRLMRTFNAAAEPFVKEGSVMAKTINVDYLARVEGEGALTIKFKGDQPERVELRIFEPPRFFEAFMRGRGHQEAPDITARICGICPVAYQMSSCHAMESALGLEVNGGIRRLRELLYCGEWIESHVLHMFMLHAPDFLGFQDALEMAKSHPQAVQNALRMKKAGNELVTVVGGREIHPINVRVGGFYRTPRTSELRALLPELQWSLACMKESTRWIAGLPIPELDRSYELVALRDEEGYAVLGGRLVSSRGLDIAIAEYEEHFEEQHVERSNALHSVLKARGAYHVGPLARINLNFDRLSQGARDLAEDIGFTVPCQNPFKSILARALETVHAMERAIEIIERYEGPARFSVGYDVKAGRGFGCTEAPRGLLYHRYDLDDQGFITEAKIVPPTSQNQLTIEDDLWALAPRLAKMAHEDATWLAEQAVRNYDPCISCATHFLKLKIERS